MSATPSIREVHEVVARWASTHDVAVDRAPPTFDHWQLRPNGATDDGTISVVLRDNEHGPIEVAPSNDTGWFERYGTTLVGLAEILDLSLADLADNSGDPSQGMP